MATASPALSSFAEDALIVTNLAATAATTLRSPAQPQSLLDGPFWIGAIALVGLLLLLALATCLKRQYEDDLSRCRLFRWKATTSGTDAADAAATADAAIRGGCQARQSTRVTAFDFDLEAGEATPSGNGADHEDTVIEQPPTLRIALSSPTAAMSDEVTAAAEAAEAEEAIRALADEVASRLARRAAADGSVLFSVDPVAGEDFDNYGEDENDRDRRCSSRRRAFARLRTTTMASAGTSESAATGTAATAVNSSGRHRRRHHRSHHGRSVCGGSRSCVDFAAMTPASVDQQGPGGDKDDYDGGGRRRRCKRRCRRCCREEAEAKADLQLQPPARDPPDAEAAVNRRRLLDRLVRQASAGCTCRRCWRRFQAEVQELRARFHGEGDGEREGEGSCGRSRRRRNSRRSCQMVEAEARPPPRESSCCCSGDGDSGVASWLLAQQPTAAEVRAKGATVVKCNSIEDMSCAAAKAAAAAVAAVEDDEEEDETDAETVAGSGNARERRRSSRQPRRPGRERRRRRSASAATGGDGIEGVVGGRVEELARRRLERFRAELRHLCEVSVPRPPPPKLLSVPPISSTAPLATASSSMTSGTMTTTVKTTAAAASATELCPQRLASPTPSQEDAAGDCRSPIVAGDTFIYVEDWNRRATESHSAILPAVGRQLRRRRLLRLRRRALDNDDEDYDDDDEESCSRQARECCGDTLATGSSRQTPTSEDVSTTNASAPLMNNYDDKAFGQSCLSAETKPSPKRRSRHLNRQGSCCSSDGRASRQGASSRPPSVKARLGDSAYQTKENSADMPARSGRNAAEVEASLRLAASKLQAADLTGSRGSCSHHCQCCGPTSQHRRQSSRRESTCNSQSKGHAADNCSADTWARHASSPAVPSCNHAKSTEPVAKQRAPVANASKSGGRSQMNASTAQMFVNFEQEFETQV